MHIPPLTMVVLGPSQGVRVVSLRDRDSPYTASVVGGMGENPIAFKHPASGAQVKLISFISLFDPCSSQLSSLF